MESKESRENATRKRLKVDERVEDVEDESDTSESEDEEKEKEKGEAKTAEELLRHKEAEMNEDSGLIRIPEQLLYATNKYYWCSAFSNLLDQLQSDGLTVEQRYIIPLRSYI